MIIFHGSICIAEVDILCLFVKFTDTRTDERKKETSKDPFILVARDLKKLKLISFKNNSKPSDTQNL